MNGVSGGGGGGGSGGFGGGIVLVLAVVMVVAAAPLVVIVVIVRTNRELTKPRHGEGECDWPREDVNEKEMRVKIVVITQEGEESVIRAAIKNELIELVTTGHGRRWKEQS